MTDHISPYITLTGNLLPERIETAGLPGWMYGEASNPFGDRYYLIRNGMYYRPDSKGYTSSMMEAGLFGETYARDVCVTTEGVTMEIAI